MKLSLLLWQIVTQTLSSRSLPKFSSTKSLLSTLHPTWLGRRGRPESGATRASGTAPRCGSCVQREGTPCARPARQRPAEQRPWHWASAASPVALDQRPAAHAPLQVAVLTTLASS